jgi:hypothetical protein
MPCNRREKLDLEEHKTRVPRICQVGMDTNMGTSNPQVVGSIPTGGAQCEVMSDSLLAIHECVNGYTDCSGNSHIE